MVIITPSFCVRMSPKINASSSAVEFHDRTATLGRAVSKATVMHVGKFHFNTDRIPTKFKILINLK